MSIKAYIKTTETEIIAVLVENDNIIEIGNYKREIPNLVGNIYKSKINKVQKGISAAFAEYDKSQSAYIELVGKNKKIPQGKEIMLRICREPKGSKLPVATSEISISGRYIVIFKDQHFKRVSDKIKDKELRAELMTQLTKCIPENYGAIIRTTAQYADFSLIEKEIHYILNKYVQIENVSKKGKVPRLLYSETHPLEHFFKNVLPEDTESILVNCMDTYKELKELSNQKYPSFESSINLYTKDYDIFAFYSLTRQIDNTKHKKILLKNGAHIVIEKTEAMTVIDVNTGHNTGGKNFEETKLDTNLQAAYEVANQIRLRNISGIIMVDFVNMTPSENNATLLNELKHIVSKDRSKVKIHGMTNLGLIEITRKAL